MKTTNELLKKNGWNKLGGHGYIKTISNQKWAIMVDDAFNIIAIGNIDKEKKPLTAETISVLNKECSRLRNRYCNVLGRRSNITYDASKVMPYVDLYFQGKIRPCEIVNTGLIAKSNLMKLIKREREKRNENK